MAFASIEETSARSALKFEKFEAQEYLTAIEIYTFPLKRCSYSKTQEHCLWFRKCIWKDDQCVGSSSTDLNEKSTGLLPWETVALMVGVQVLLFLLTLTIMSFPAIAEKLHLWRLWIQRTLYEWCINCVFCCIVHRHCPAREAHYEQGPQEQQRQQPQQRQNEDIRIEMESLLLSV